jgi:tRNA threonylcarbamoyladenosine biosynthesis protein TsaB
MNMTTQMKHDCWLAIDTTGQGCHVALYYQGKMSHSSDMSPQSHAKRLLPMIEALLADNKLKQSALTGIIYTRGPGSFTGVRIGVSVVQGLALALNLPTVGVSSLLALAWQGHLATGVAFVTAMIDAHMGQVYWGEYQFGNTWQIDEQDNLSTPESVILNPATQLLIGDTDILTNAQPQWQAIPQMNQTVVRVEDLFSLVKSTQQQGRLNWETTLALPLYLRHDVAALPKKKADEVVV